MKYIGNTFSYAFWNNKNSNNIQFYNKQKKIYWKATYEKLFENDVINSNIWFVCLSFL